MSIPYVFNIVPTTGKVVFNVNPIEVPPWPSVQAAGRPWKPPLHRSCSATGGNGGRPGTAAGWDGDSAGLWFG